MRSGWEPQGSWRESMPIGRAAERFLWEIADYGIYLRLRRDDPCPLHWDDTGSPEGGRRPDAPCAACWGTGLKVLPVVTPLKLAQGPAIDQSELMLQAGLVPKWMSTAIVPRGLRAAEQDFLMLVEWNVPLRSIPTSQTRRPLRLVSAMQVDTVYDRSAGEVSFAALGLKTAEVEQDLFSKTLPLMADLPLLPRDRDWS